MIALTVDTQTLRGMCAGMEKQLPFATAKALNEVAGFFQRDQRAVMQKQFTIRRQWVLQGVKIDRGDFATKQKLNVRIHIDEKQDFFNKFEEGGTRSPRSGGKSLAIPINVRGSKTGLIPASKKPRAFDFKEVGGRGLVTHAKRFKSGRLRSAALEGNVRVYEGAKRTIMIKGSNGGGIILQRVGRGKAAGLKVLYRLKARTPVPASLHFHDTARESFTAHWPSSFEKWWNEAVRTSKQNGPVAHGMALPSGW